MMPERSHFLRSLMISRMTQSIARTITPRDVRPVIRSGGMEKRNVRNSTTVMAQPLFSDDDSKNEFLRASILEAVFRIFTKILDISF
jgi:hypothetical protein